MNDTKERLLDTAERLFAERGYDATSLRSIIAAAHANLAAVHYHFRSKEALLEAVVKRRIEPVNRERLALLDACERAGGDRPPSLEAVLTALMAPPLALARDPAHATFVTLMGRLMVEADVNFVQRHFGEIFQRFLAAVRRALPGLPEEDFRWRVFFTMGAMIHALRGRPEIVGLSEEVTVERLVNFLAAGLRAPLATAARSNE